MKKIFKVIIFTIITVLFTNISVFGKNNSDDYDIMVKQDLLCLMLAYSDYIK